MPVATSTAPEIVAGNVVPIRKHQEEAPIKSINLQELSVGSSVTVAYTTERNNSERCTITIGENCVVATPAAHAEHKRAYLAQFLTGVTVTSDDKFMKNIVSRDEPCRVGWLIEHNGPFVIDDCEFGTVMFITVD